MNFNKKNALIIILILALIVSISTVTLIIPKSKKQNETPQSQSLTQIPLTIKNNKLSIKIAKTSEEKAKGLMFVESMPENQGMLFVFDDEDKRTFWMKNTLIPLDMLWIDKNKQIVDIITAQPCKQDPCPTYSSDQKAKYILELNADYCEQDNIQKGDKVEFEL